jgi:CRISPR-associated protein Csm5
MNGIPQARKLWITPLSPVHMGTDEDYAPTNYVIEGNALFELDHRALKSLPRAEKKRLNTLLNDKADERLLKEVQAFFYGNREWLIPSAINVVKTSNETAALYKSRVGRAAQIESGGREVQNRLEIQRASYNPVDRRLFLPGSGLKGAMRTALLDDINQGKRLQHGERSRELQQRLFGYTMRDLHKDPMRLVQVGDCAWCGPDELNSAEILFAVNRKKQPVKMHGTLVQSQAEKQGLYQLLECAVPFRVRVFHGLLAIRDISGVENQSGKLPAFRFGFAEIAAACNRFYRPIWNHEIALLHKRGFLDAQWQTQVREILSDPVIMQKLERNEAFLLRVGRHSGAESVTLNGVRSIRIMKARGEKPDWMSESKTLWLAATDRNDQRGLRPFGWILVEMAEADQTLATWTKADDIAEKILDRMSVWLDTVRSRQRELQEKVDALVAVEAARVKEEAERKAEESRREAEQEARLKAMTPLEREMEAICQKEKSGNPGAVLLNKLNAGHWDAAEDQRNVAERIRTLWGAEKKWCPDFSGKNKQKVKQRDRCRMVLKWLGQVQ